MNFVLDMPFYRTRRSSRRPPKAWARLSLIALARTNGSCACDWIKLDTLVVTLISGGAIGAIITLIVGAYRARRQPVGRRVEIVPVFRQSGGSSSLRAKIAITREERTLTFENLFLAEVQIINKGNADMNEFEFGATLGENDRCIYVEIAPPDRHHEVMLLTRVIPEAPRREIDFRPPDINDTKATHRAELFPRPQDAWDTDRRRSR